MADVTPDENAAAPGPLSLIGGGIKIAYDLAIPATFRSIRPPEEADRAPSQLSPVRK